MACFSHSTSAVDHHFRSTAIDHEIRGGNLSPSNYLLKLYVTGTSPRAELAVTNLRRICEHDLNGRYELQVIDVVAHPQAAEDAKILATPTLVKLLPPPLRRVIGDLSDRERVLLGLDVQPAADDGGGTLTHSESE
ncbi:MAG TPA: circadian clock protein KaiB [Gemmatimonadaceae bacterium]|nr:circadian clock protein KaiB [Gemmatimonadaceae bacterium]